MEFNSTQKPKYILQSKASFKDFLLRNIWMYLIYFAVISIIYICRVDILNKIPNIQNIDSFSLGIVGMLLLFVLTTGIYLRISIEMYKRTVARKCNFFDKYLMYENPYALIKQKDVSYENINGVVLQRNILDYIFNTGTIRIKKAVEYDEGMAIQVVKRPKEILEDIKSIVNLSC